MDDLGTKLGYADYCAIPEDGQRHEIVDGTHYVNPAPGLPHQAVLTQLVIELGLAIDRAGYGKVLVAPFEVQLSEHDVVQPDVIVVLENDRHVITQSRIVGTPSLVVEVLSPGNARHDRERKFELYQESGVREYWIVDPAERCVSQFALAGGRYERIADARDALRLHVLPEVEIALAHVWA